MCLEKGIKILGRNAIGVVEHYINKKTVDKTKFKTNLTVHAVCNAGGKTCLTFALSYFKYLKLQFAELGNCMYLANIQCTQINDLASLTAILFTVCK